MGDKDKDKTDKTVDDDDDGKKKEPTLTEVINAIRYMNQQHKDLAAEVKTIGKVSSVKDDDRQKDKDKDKPIVDKPSDSDLDDMSRSEFSDHISSSIAAQIKDQVFNPMQSRLNALEKRGEERFAKDDLSAAEGKFDDFWDWNDEIKKLLDERPDLSIDDAYHVAKGRDPAKAKTLGDKRQDVADKKATDEAAVKDEEYGGLLPTSGQSTDNEGMEPEKAAEAAWDKLVAGTPHETMLRNN